MHLPTIRGFIKSGILLLFFILTFTPQADETKNTSTDDIWSCIAKQLPEKIRNILILSCKKPMHSLTEFYPKIQSH